MRRNDLDEAERVMLEAAPICISSVSGPACMLPCVLFWPVVAFESLALPVPPDAFFLSIRIFSDKKKC